MKFEPIRYKGILMDIDNTVYDYDASHPIALTAVMDYLAQETGLPEEKLRNAYETSRQQVHHEHPKTASGHNRALYFHRLCELLGLNAGTLVAKADQTYWDTFIEHMTLFPGVRTFLEGIKPLKLVFVTDLLTHIQFRKIRHLGLDRYNPMVVTSEEVGVEKPDAEIFKAALSKLRLGCQEVCMIGDSLKRDILGAQELGIQAFWFRGQPSTLADHSNVLCFNDYNDLGRYIHV